MSSQPTPPPAGKPQPGPKTPPPTSAAVTMLVVACAQCGQRNRVLPNHPGAEATCGRCKRPLFPAEPVIATDGNWQKVVEQAGLPVLVDFWAPWCGPCRAVAPVLDAIARERAGHLRVAKLNVDENPQTASRFGIQAIPTMMIFKGSQVIDQIRGALPRPALEARLNQLKL